MVSLGINLPVLRRCRRVLRAPGAQIHHGGLALVVIVAAAMCGPAFESAIAQIPVSDERRWRQVATGWDAGGGVLLRSAHAPEAPLRAGRPGVT
jgi:hypothetical protein